MQLQNRADARAPLAAAARSKITGRVVVFIVLAVILLLGWCLFLVFRTRRQHVAFAPGFPPNLHHAPEDAAAYAAAAAEPELIEDAAAVSVAFDQTMTIVNPAGALPAASNERPVSVVIVSHHESLLAATVNEILRTPSQEQIGEILIVDDVSQPPVAYADFNADARIVIHRAKERLGLIKARITGGNLAQGKFLVRRCRYFLRRYLLWCTFGFVSV